LKVLQAEPKLYDRKAFQSAVVVAPIPANERILILFYL